jgi:hypothetical protein
MRSKLLEICFKTRKPHWCILCQPISRWTNYTEFVIVQGERNLMSQLYSSIYILAYLKRANFSEQIL